MRRGSLLASLPVAVAVLLIAVVSPASAARHDGKGHGPPRMVTHAYMVYGAKNFERDGSLASAFGSWTGRVASFDDRVGAGVVRADGTDEEWAFHCTRIADGSRTIPEGAWVSFEVVPGPTGLEAVDLRRRAT